MEPRRTQARRGGLIALAALLVFGASACSGGTGLVGTPPAASVNGQHIDADAVDQMVQGSKALLEAQITQERANVGSDPTQSAGLESAIAEARAPFERGPYTYSTTAGSRALTELIVSELYAQAVADAGGEITEEDRSEAEQQLTQQAGFADANEIVRDTYLEGGAATIALRRLVPAELQDALDGAADEYEAQLRQIYEQEQESFEQVCAFTIRAADEAAGNAAIDRVRSGEDAAAVATELAGPEAGPAEPQCYSAAAVAQGFGTDGTIEAGAVLGPLADGDGFVVLVVDSTGVQSFEEARATIAQNVQDEFTAQAQADVDAWIQERVARSADIEVDPRFGTWDAEALQVVPPVAPATTTTAAGTATTVPAAPVAGS